MAVKGIFITTSALTVQARDFAERVGHGVDQSAQVARTACSVRRWEWRRKRQRQIESGSGKPQGVEDITILAMRRVCHGWACDSTAPF
jgi:hypothetical protein